MSDIAPSQIWRALLPRGAVAYETRSFVHAPLLFAAERRCVETAVEKRIAEFAAGRLCARRALADLGHPDFPLLRGTDRRPLWPDGVAGSITHTDRYCGVAAARRGDFSGIGIDAEEIARLDDHLLPQICTPDERRRLAALAQPQRQAQTALIFSAKEAFYKCHTSAGGGWLGFQDAEVQFVGGRFHVYRVGSPDLAGDGAYAVQDGMAFCAVAFVAR